MSPNNQGKTTLYFASNNLHKIEEVRQILSKIFHVLSLKDLAPGIEIPETGSTLEENSRIKAKYLHDNFNVNVFADDTGLEVRALDGKPGVYSARFAGEPADDHKNVSLLLSSLEGVEDRRARFRTVVTLILDDKEYQFEGIANGVISRKRSGAYGFGYDPVFIPDNYEKSFAQMTQQEKNKISHRGIAMRKFADYLLT